MNALTYDDFIINALSKDVCKNKLNQFCKQIGIGHNTLTARELIEKLLYEYGVTNAELKNIFKEYLGVEACYFIKKYKVDAALLLRLNEKGLLLATKIDKNTFYYDAEFYYIDMKFKKAVQIYEKYIETH